MIRKKLNALTRLSAILILAVLAATSLIGAYIATSIITTSQTIQIHKELSINEIMPTAKVVVQVQHKDGTTETIEKEGDPWTWNLVAIIGNIFLGRYYAGSPLTIYKTDGGAASFIEDYYYFSGSSDTLTNPVAPLVAIGIGSGSTAPSRYDIELINPITKIDVSSAGVTVTDDGTTITATYSASYTASSDLTVRETAFYIKAVFVQSISNYPYTGSQSASYVMLARDVLQSPVSLVSGDVITVTYQISMNYATPPMTRNLAYLIYNNIFGLSYYNMGRQIIDFSGNAFVLIDLGHDYYVSNRDTIRESAGIAFGTGPPQYMFNKASIGQVQSLEPVTVSIQLVNSTHTKISLNTGTSFTSTVTITEVGFYFYTDIGASSTNTDSAKATTLAKVLLLYFPLQSSLSVPAGAGVRFSFDLYIQLAPSS